MRINAAGVQLTAVITVRSFLTVRNRIPVTHEVRAHFRGDSRACDQRTGLIHYLWDLGPPISRKFYNGTVTTESQHTCILDREYPTGIMACRCGQFWMPAGGIMLTIAFVDYDLRERLREYQADVAWGRFDSLADAVRAASARDRKARAVATVRARDDWHRLQAAKRAKWWRCVRPIILSQPCAYCGGTATAIDHIVPQSRGGTDRMRNLAPSCSPCNGEKNNRTPEEWKTWRLRLGRPWPPLPRGEAA